MSNNYSVSIAKENRIMILERAVKDSLEVLTELDESLVDADLIERLERILDEDTDDMFEDNEDEDEELV